MELAFFQDGPVYTESRRIFDGEPVPAGAVAIFGVPFDSTTTNRPGARFGPDALRMASAQHELYSPEQDVDLETLDYCDLGNLVLPLGAPDPVVQLVREATDRVLDAGALPLVLGGEHSISVGVFQAQAARHPDLVVIQLDAHADLRPDYLDSPFSHACAMRRCLDVVKPENVAQVGIRSGTPEEFAELRSSKRLLRPTAQAVSAFLAQHPNQPVHLTIDLDVFDPAAFPGTGTPEPGGIFWPEFAAILAAVPKAQLVGADVVELAPEWDPTGCSAVLAAKVVRELVCKLGTRDRAAV